MRPISESMDVTEERFRELCCRLGLEVVNVYRLHPLRALLRGTVSGPPIFLTWEEARLGIALRRAGVSFSGGYWTFEDSP